MVFLCSDYLKEVMKRVKEMSEQKQNTFHTNHRGGHFMFKLMKKRIKNEKGLTLIEVLAVVVILAIVAMIAIPAIGNLIENNRIKAIKADAVNIISAANLYFTDVGTAEDFNEDTGADYIESVGTIEEGWSVKYNSDKKVAEFTGKGKSGSVEITFTNATIDAINAETTDEGEGVVIKR